MAIKVARIREVAKIDAFMIYTSTCGLLMRGFVAVRHWLRQSAKLLAVSSSRARSALIPQKKQTRLLPRNVRVLRARPAASRGNLRSVRSVPLRSRRRRVVALPHLHLQVLAAVSLAVHADMPETPVLLVIAGRVARHILCAQLVLYLLERRLQLGSVVAHVDHPAARLIRNLLRRRVAVVTHALVPVHLPVGNQDHVDNYVIALRR